MDIAKIKSLAALSMACETASHSSGYEVLGVDGYGVHLSESAFKAIFGQGDRIRRDNGVYPYEHVALVNGVRVFCLGGWTI